MNERIRKFAKKSGFSLDSTEIYTAKLEHLPITENMEKFAELIVRECMDILPEKVKIDDLYDGRILVQCGMAIKEHFGVEE